MVYSLPYEMVMEERRKLPPEAIGAVVMNYKNKAEGYLAGTGRYLETLEDRYKEIRIIQRTIGELQDAWDAQSDIIVDDTDASAIEAKRKNAATKYREAKAYFGTYSPQEPDEDELSKRITQFENEVYCCNEELAFIEKVHVNPLELLFEAEAALALSEKQVEYSGDTRSESSDDTTPDTEFVDDPIELMKKLKKKRGGA